jgi:hypothetical protein
VNSKHIYFIDKNSGYNNKLIANVSNAKFLGIVTDNTSSWRIPIEHIGTKLSAACHAMGSVKPYMSQETLKMVYYSCLHSIMSYRLIFWGNFSYTVKLLGYRVYN